LIRPSALVSIAEPSFGTVSLESPRQRN